MSHSDSRLPDDFSSGMESPGSSGRLRVSMEITVAALILIGIYLLFAPEEQIELEPPLQESRIDPIIRARIDSAQRAKSPPTDTPAKVTEPESEIPADNTESVTMNAPVGRAPADGEAARAIISGLRAGETTLTPTQILDQSNAFRREGRLSDAYLLLFYAARNGDGQAAFSLAGLHDPNHFVKGNSLSEKPDPYQAHKWYTVAAGQGVTKAQERLKILRSTMEELAKTGDLTAQRLLLNWQ
ncbi:MAG: deoxyribonuclease [Candidatus Thiodiazotropha sp. (ex Epidulcina cf. delphinae)]|nr:deoxyribonuclease [Candidatus Thiodiazotropha sp. (ex Epidulcina cf. delphinae)]